MRRAHRLGLIESESTGDDVPPGPFDDDGGAAYADWLCEPFSTEGVSALLLGRWDLDRSLRAHFPEPLGEHAAAYAEWARSDVHGDVVAPQALYERACVEPREVEHGPLVVGRPERFDRGLNIFGYLDSELSVGHVARSVVRAAAAVGLSHDVLATRAPHGSHRSDTAVQRSGRWGHDVNVMCVNADRVPASVHVLGSAAFDARPTAGVWFWEAPTFPDSVAEAFGLVDEVWAPTEFVADAARAAGLATRLVPLPIELPGWETRRTRADVGMPEGFVFLFAFDWLSVAERKNPLGLVDAYTRAFRPDDGASLVFKTINGDVAWRDLDELRIAIGDRPDIVLIDACVRAWEVSAMIQLCDCYVSLHRSEGFGLTIADAMAAGKPTIATAWSGNLDFMHPDVAHLVPAAMVPVPEDVPFYGGLGDWADPNLDVAAGMMRDVFDDRPGRESLGAKAREHIARTRNLDVTGRALEKASRALREVWADQ